MKVLKKIGKVMAVLFLILMLGLTALDIYMIKMPEMRAKVKIDGIEDAACRVEDLTIPENVKVIGLGEASHGNAEFQELKLEVLKVLVDKYNVDCFAMEMDYGEGVIINDYINGHSGMSIDEVMSRISFPIYRTEDIRDLIEWMKDYNLSHVDKLSFYGFDLQNPDVDLKLILDFAADNSIVEGEGLAEIFEPYLNSDVSFRDTGLSEGFEMLSSLETALKTGREAYQDLYNYERILECIENVLRARELAARYDGDNGMVEGGQYRDMMMALKVIELSEALNGSRMMITGHNGHIGYAGNFTRTMGSFIRDELGDSYYAIGTDYFITYCNMPSGSGRRSNHRFVSGDILAYQAKMIGTYYLDFSMVSEGTEVYRYIHEPIYTGSLGEGYSIRNTILQDTVRIYCEPEYLYDAMILIYECTPLDLLP
ncbi:MAG: erythromycin esterase family protein [Solobacterium sp.]|nr:erythromycin esterase family protein [Solobacterium sp.]